jgi:hypothetical protein
VSAGVVAVQIGRALFTTELHNYAADAAVQATVRIWHMFGLIPPDDLALEVRRILSETRQAQNYDILTARHEDRP